jgi:putative zinc finger protein
VSPRRPPRSCRAARDRMTLLYYGALAPADKEDLQRHIDSCRSCALEWDATRRCLDAAAPETLFPRETEVDWREFTRVAAARARAAEATEFAAAPSPGRVRLSVVQAAGSPTFARFALLAAAALVAAILWNAWPRSAGMHGGAPESSGSGVGGQTLASLLESAHAMQGRLERQGAARYLSDSRALLVNIVGPAAPCRRGGGQYDLTFEKERSRQLLRRQNLYEGGLGALQDQRLARIVRQLESVLMQVAALDDCASASQIHDLREQIETRQILLRIDLVTREMQGRADVI